MRLKSKLAALACALTLGALAVPGDLGQAGAQEDSKTVKSARGGFLATTKHYQFEVFFYDTGVRVFPQDKAGTAVDASQFEANATFYHPNSPKPWFSRSLRGTPESLDLAIGLRNAPQSGGKVAFEITGISGTTESKSTFTVPLQFVPRPTVAQPTAPAGGVPIVPRYVYGFGNQGYSYYTNTSPAPESHPSARQSYMSSIPGMYGPGGMTVGAGHRDWSTGRDSPLSKPWLQARD